MGSFERARSRWAWDDVRAGIASCSARDVELALGRSMCQDTQGMDGFLALISPAAAPFLAEMVELSQMKTRRRFGRVIQLYAPLYLSNECQNICTYCGFSVDVKRPRLTLDEATLATELDALAGEGFNHVLLVSGEATRTVGIDYFLRCLPIVRQRFSQIAMEVQPMTEDEYRRLIAAGVSAVPVYQETYDEAGYAQFHPKGRKSDFAYRLETPDRLGRAGIRKIGLGVLLGLSDWRADAFMMALHLDYLRTAYWRTHYSISFPRLREAECEFTPPVGVSDRDLVQMICAFRLFDGSVDLVLSTREGPRLRDRLVHFGITTMSAGSRTEPGGYSSPESGVLGQFEISDERSPAVVAAMLCEAGLDPVFKDWDAALDGGFGEEESTSHAPGRMLSMNAP